MQNIDGHKSFGGCFIRHSNTTKYNLAKIGNADKEYVNKLSFERIEFPPWNVVIRLTIWIILELMCLFMKTNVLIQFALQRKVWNACWNVNDKRLSMRKKI